MSSAELQSSEMAIFCAETYNQNMSLRKQIEDYLSKNIIMQLATSKDNKPWCSNLHYAFDDKLNLYWMSLQNCRHSQEVAANDQVAITVAKPHAPGERPQGLQFEGTASIAEDFEQAFSIYMERYPHWLFKEEELRRGGREDRALYKFTPTRIVMFDVANHPDNPKQELLLKT